MASAWTDDCYAGVVNFSKFYKSYVHGYVSLLICGVGSVTNIITVIVLTRKNMASPTNTVLTGMVAADLAFLLNYIPLICYEFSSQEPSYGWWWFKLWLMNFAQMYRAISIWMTIMLAIRRYLAIVHPMETQNWCNEKTTYRWVMAGCVLCPLLCVPLFISGNVVLTNQDPDQSANKTITVEPPMYEIRYTDKPILNMTFRAEIGYYIFSVFLKLMPSIVLTILSLRLVFTLLETKTRKKSLTTSLHMGKTVNRENSCLNQRNSDRQEQQKMMDRTTRMLLALLFLFLLAEVPQGILAFLMITYQTNFHKACYSRVGDILNLLKMIDAAVNFPVFYFMSCNFHDTCHTLFNYNKPVARKNSRSTNATDYTNSDVCM